MFFLFSGTKRVDYLLKLQKMQYNQVSNSFSGLLVLSLGTTVNTNIKHSELFSQCEAAPITAADLVTPGKENEGAIIIVLKVVKLPG